MPEMSENYFSIVILNKTIIYVIVVANQVLQFLEKICISALTIFTVSAVKYTSISKNLKIPQIFELFYRMSIGQFCIWE